MKKINFTFIFLISALIAGLTGCGAGGGAPGAGGGLASLNWSPPTTNADGTPASDLAGYKIYYGISSGKYTKSVDVGAVTSFTISNLPSGPNYFAVSAYDSYGIESGLSPEVSKTL